MTVADLTEILRLHRLWRNGNPTGARANLTEADLSGANLSEADLTGADLTGADLTGADLSEADLSGANLSGANLSGAYLSGAYLSGAYLSGANLSGANLSGANLSGANLSGANLESVRPPDGNRWWQGGAYGPRRRMIRALRSPDGAVTVMAGCLHGDRATVEIGLDARSEDWISEIGAEAATRELADALHLIELAVAHVTRESAA